MATTPGGRTNYTNSNNKNKSKSNAEKNTNRMTIIIVVLLTVLLILALVFAFSQGITFEATTTYTTTITQSKVREDGTPKTVTVTYNVEVDGTDVPKDEVEAVLVETMNDFSYEEFTGDNAIENLKTSAMANMDKRFGGGNVTSIYVSDYNADAPITNGENVNTESVENRNGIMKGLFKGMD